MSVGDDLWNRGVCWAKLVIVSASGERGVCNVMEIVGALTFVGDIWSRRQLGGTDHGARAGDAAVGRNNLPGTNTF